MPSFCAARSMKTLSTGKGIGGSRTETFNGRPALATLSIHNDRSAGRVHCNVWSGGMGANPVDCSLGVRVGRKHGIDAVQNTSLPNDEREALEQAHALHLERRQPQRS